MKELIKEKGEGILLFLGFFIFYCFWQVKSIYGGDSGDLVTAAWVWGIPHPPGYPLYALLASILVHALPFYTPAWRVGLISSFSSAATLAIFYLLLKKMTHSHPDGAKRLKDLSGNWVALLGTLTLAFLYPFWLYSEVAEVFALNNLFIILLSYLFFGIVKQTARSRPARTGLFFLILGLSLAHHHTVVLLFPGFLYILYKNKKLWSRIKKSASRRAPILALLFLLGFSFYVYPLIACRKNPLVCWDDPINLKNLFHLITRADYGTFRSSNKLGNAPALRLFSLASFFRLAWEDFRLLGLVLVVLGLYRSYKNHQKNKDYLFPFLAITLFVCLFFIFYASFILVNDFMVGTFERFIILPYIFMVLSLSISADWLYRRSQSLLRRFQLSDVGKRVFLMGFKLILFVIPISFLLFNFPKISILKNDLTAEKMAEDFLVPLPPKSILVVSSDTSVFNSQYVRYVLGYREDVVLISYPLLPAPYYQKSLKKAFPHLKFSEKKDQIENLEEFVKTNLDQSPIFVDRYSFEPQTDWLPYGLALQYLPEDQRPSVDEIVVKNLAIWNHYHDPFAGSLKKFESLFLSDVLRVYQNGRINMADFLLQNDYLDKAEEFFMEAKKLKPEFEDADIGLGAVWLKRGDCDQAQSYFLKALALNEKNPLLLGYLRKTALECFGDESEAKKFEEQCIQLKQGKTIKLTE